jgi:predicted pyridoxine 5'-phosphate oxidase superfamily flavin-nucleotide-binding protein
VSLTVRPDEVMFSASVRAEQARRGSRSAYGRRAKRGGFAAELPPEVAAFIAERDSAYLATASADGQPYVQHRGGPRGFVHVLDARTLAFADFAGNRQYISIGNLAENERAFLFFMDYAAGRRLKLWGRASVIEAGSELTARLSAPGYPARVERAILFRIEAWDWNCPQHIPRLVPAE